MLRCMSAETTSPAMLGAAGERPHHDVDPARARVDDRGRPPAAGGGPVALDGPADARDTMNPNRTGSAATRSSR